MVETNGSAAEETANNEAITPGSALRQGRECAGLSLEAVAEQLNLLPSQLRALEEDRYQVFPGEIFVKGHLGAYARLLKLDVGAVLGGYCGSVTSESPSTLLCERDSRWRPVPLTKRVNRWRRYSGLMGTFLVLLALWGWQQHRDRDHLLSLTAATGSELGGIDSALNSGADSVLLDSVQLLPSKSVSSTPVALAGAKGDATAKAAAEAADDSDSLSLRFSADCWVEVKDRDNHLLVATLKHADDQLKLEGRGPFKVLLGYAPGVAMAYNGTPVKVDVPEGSRATRMIVGSS